MRRVKVLHVIGQMNAGGAETWLLHVLRRLNPERFQTDLLVHSLEPGLYDEEVVQLGARLIPCLHPNHPVSCARQLRRILERYGPYDVLHSHLHHLSGFVMRAGRSCGVPVRIAHSHNDTRSVDAGSSWARRSYLRLAKRWIRAYATAGLAVSPEAAAALFGPEWQRDQRWRVLPCGIDLAPFREPVPREAVRADLGIPQEAFVVGHVGRFLPQKNHRFFVDVAEEVAGREPRGRFLLIGEGPLRPEIELEIQRRGLGARFRFAGVRRDVPRLMSGAMDVLLFPSVHEGLPLVLMEAQAAGLPCVVSDSVPRSAEVVPGLVSRLSLNTQPSVWAEIVLAAGRSSDKPGRPDALCCVARSAFNIEASVRALQSLYAAAPVSVAATAR